MFEPETLEQGWGTCSQWAKCSLCEHLIWPTKQSSTISQKKSLFLIVTSR